MEITTKQVLKILYVISWIIFAGICIEASGYIFNTLFTLFINPVDAKHFWPGINFSSLYQFDKGHFAVEALHMAMPAFFRAYLFYLIIKILHDKKLNMAQPFNKETGRFIFNSLMCLY
jgi:hypothetical protein